MELCPPVVEPDVELCPPVLVPDPAPLVSVSVAKPPPDESVSEVVPELLLRVGPDPMELWVPDPGGGTPGPLPPLGSPPQARAKLSAIQEARGMGRSLATTLPRKAQSYPTGGQP